MVRTLILSPKRIQRALSRLACEVDERNRGTSDLVLLGIEPNGMVVARALAEHVSALAGRTIVPMSLGIKGDTYETYDVTGRHVLFVDDVLYTGRTAHRALNAVCQMGPPASVQFVALIDRGHRELPLQPDYVGLRLQTKYTERIHVDTAADLAVYLVEDSAAQDSTGSPA